ncbi:MAG: glucose 1-dehydrogenase [Myxococcota bacterium]
MGRLEGKTTIVTGAARGIGAATARRFVAEGANVLLTDVLVDDGKATAAELGSAARFAEHDVSDETQWPKIVELCEREFGAPSVLVNNAGIGGAHFELLETLSPDLARKILDINVIGVMLGIQAVVPAMAAAGGGSIVNLSSTASVSPMNALAIYSASKSAVSGMTKAAAMELGPRGIRVNSVQPGGADTAMGNAMGVPLEEYSKYQGHTPLQRACHADEIASGVLYLASDESLHCTGTELLIDGGQAAGVWMKTLPGGPPRRKRS